MKPLFVGFLLIFCWVMGSPDVTRTGRGRLRADEQFYNPTPSPDTIRGSRLDSLTTAGYDKPLRSRQESLFIVNHTPDNLQEVTLELTYTDSKGRLLHRATQKINTPIPAGETRLVKFPSWDVQTAFYYFRSPRPQRVQQATPYQVSIRVVEALTQKH